MLKTMWQNKAKDKGQENVAWNARTGRQGNAQASARAKRTWKEMPRMMAKRTRHGTPKLNAEINVAKESQGR